jgi:hypothetical protein
MKQKLPRLIWDYCLGSTAAAFLLLGIFFGLIFQILFPILAQKGSLKLLSSDAGDDLKLLVTNRPVDNIFDGLVVFCIATCH